ncbi:MAG: Tn3 family transposase [Actinomycetota bacterium]|nr:Tn3 family transposase [Actinomycetota bacterium]
MARRGSSGCAHPRRTRRRDISCSSEKFTYLKELGAEEVDLSMLPPGRVRMLAGEGRRRPAWELARLAASRRLAVLLAFCAQTLVGRGDELIDLYAAGVQNAERHARFAVAKHREQTAKARDDHAWLGQTLARILVDALESGEEPVARAVREVGEARLRAAAQDPGRLTRRVEEQRRDALAARHAHLAQFAPRVLAGLDLHAAPGDQPLLDAIRHVETNRRRTLLPDAPLEVLSPTYRAWVVDEQGRVVRTRYEIALWLAARDALRARRLYRAGSHRYGDPAAWMMPAAQWSAERVELAAVFARPLDARVRLDELQVEQERRVRGLQQGYESGVDVLYDGQQIVGRRPRAQLLPDSTRRLVSSTHAMLPKVSLAALIIDVDRDTAFMDELPHAGGQQARSPERRGQLFAALVAAATGMGYTRMAEACRFTERQLREATERHLTIEHVAAADARVCEAIRGLAQSSTIDLERISSSDGQRYPIIGRSAIAGFAAREAGYRRRMVTWMIWINQQYAHFGSKVISVTEREGLHTLDAIVLADDAPEIHTADTHGATELVFGAFDLLGRRFIPRLKDIADVPLYGLGAGQPHLAADMLLARKVRDEMIAGQWEELMRLAGSIKRGWIVPSVLLTRMHADPRPDRLAKALREYGRLVRTNFVLDWAGDPDLRSRGLGQLNKGESANALHRYVGFGNRGRVHARDPEQLQRHMDCRRLITNAIVYWNTRYIAHALETLERQGHTMRDDDIRHIHPVHFEHINPFGHYRFDTRRGPAKGRLRPLRAATYISREAATTNATATNA